MTTLRYRRLTPNYQRHWQADSDAALSVDRFEVFLCFTSRGHECLNCDGTILSPIFQSPLIIRVNTPAKGADRK
jgi:hypothetical protein